MRGSRSRRGSRQISRGRGTSDFAYGKSPRNIRNKSGHLSSVANRIVIEPHRHPGVYIAKSKEDMLVTKNMLPGMTFLLFFIFVSTSALIILDIRSIEIFYPFKVFPFDILSYF